MTTDLLAVPSTDPVDIYRVRDGIYAADMLLTAIVQLDLFSRLAEEPATSRRDLPLRSTRRRGRRT